MLTFYQMLLTAVIKARLQEYINNPDRQKILKANVPAKTSIQNQRKKDSGYTVSGFYRASTRFFSSTVSTVTDFAQHPAAYAMDHRTTRKKLKIAQELNDQLDSIIESIDSGASNSSEEKHDDDWFTEQVETGLQDALNKLEDDTTGELVKWLGSFIFLINQLNLDFSNRFRFKLKDVHFDERPEHQFLNTVLLYHYHRVAGDLFDNENRGALGIFFKTTLNKVSGRADVRAAKVKSTFDLVRDLRSRQADVAFSLEKAITSALDTLDNTLLEHASRFDLIQFLPVPALVRNVARQAVSLRHLNVEHRGGRLEAALRQLAEKHGIDLSSYHQRSTFRAS